MVPLRRASVFTTGPVENRGGLVGWWTFDDGTATDFSGSQTHGALLNAPPCVPGMVGNALSFNGSTQGVEVGLSGNPIDTVGREPYTLMAWINPASTQDGIIVGRLSTGTEVIHLRINRGASNKIEMRYPGPAAAESTTTASSVVGKWTHVAGVGDGTNLNLYINGVREAQTAYTQGSILAGTTSIGKDQANNGTYFNGVIDDVRIYRTALTASDVFSIYASAFVPWMEWEMPAFSPPPWPPVPDTSVNKLRVVRSAMSYW